MKRPKGPHYARELEVRYTTHRSRVAVAVDGKQIITAAAAAAVVVPMLESQTQEVFLVLHLDAKRRLLGVQEVGRGKLTEVGVSIRAIFTAVLGERNSNAILLAHNHPSGDPEPSMADIELTKAVVEAARLFEVEVLDHLIVGHERYVSFRDTGRLYRL